MQAPSPEKLFLFFPRRVLTSCYRISAVLSQASAVFDIGEEYEFEIIKGDDGDGCLTLSVRKIQVRGRERRNTSPVLLDGAFFFSLCLEARFRPKS